jgi:hypothetical protein
MLTLDPTAFHAALDARFGFIGYEAPKPTPQRSKVPDEIQAARNDLRRKGWSQAAAASRLGVSAIHLCYVLNGHRISRRLINAIHHLPENSELA